MVERDDSWLKKYWCIHRMMRCYLHATHAKLYQTILSQGFAHMVTEFRIRFVKCNYIWIPKRILQRCTCDEFDAMLGQVLLSLQNLQVLHFICWGCRAERARHRYLAELPTKNLQKVMFNCVCTSQLPSNTYQMLASPCMAPVMSLSLFDIGAWKDCDVLSARSSLPHLKKLICSDIKPIELLFSKQTITHFSFFKNVTDFDPLHNIISRASCSLTYLQVYNLQHTIPGFIAKDSAPYRSLKHLGDLYYGRVVVRDFSELFEQA